MMIIHAAEGRPCTRNALCKRPRSAWSGQNDDDSRQHAGDAALVVLEPRRPVSIISIATRTTLRRCRPSSIPARTFPRARAACGSRSRAIALAITQRLAIWALDNRRRDDLLSLLLGGRPNRDAARRPLGRKRRPPSASVLARQKRPFQRNNFEAPQNF